ncbi:dolichol-phosphate mannosyltransferase subunit 3 [Nannochloropsis oceanica]
MSTSPPAPPLSSSAISFPRWVGLLLCFIISSTVWATLYIDPWQSFRFTAPVRQVLQTFPFWALVSLGAYTLANIGINLIYFNSCPEAAVGLAKDIREAKADLIQKGFKMDY